MPKRIENQIDKLKTKISKTTAINKTGTKNSLNLLFLLTESVRKINKRKREEMLSISIIGCPKATGLKSAETITTIAAMPHVRLVMPK